MNVFISYRRDDSALAAKLLHGELVKHFGSNDVFMDIDGIGYGDDFVAAIDRHLARADTVVVVIGPRWLDMLQARMRGDDWVREEVRRALARRAASGKPRVIPVLVEGAAPPGEGLPEDLQALRSLNMLSLDPRALNASLNTLVEAVRNKRFDEQAYELRRRWQMGFAAAAVGVAVFLGGWVSLFDALGLDTRAATATMMLSSMLPGAAAPWSDTVVLAAIDEQTVAAVGRPFGPAWRTEHAQFLRRAADAGARTVAFDVTFAADGPDAADTALREALAAVKARLPVVVGVQEMDGNEPRIVPRLAGLVHWGIACAGQRLGLSRLMPLFVARQRPGAKPDDEPLMLPSLALAAFSGGGRIKPPGPLEQRVTFVRGDEPGELQFHTFERITRPQPGCEAIRPGDHVASQLFDPNALPPLDRAPQKVAYEDILRGEPNALAALSKRIVLVGVRIAGQDRTAISGGGERWGTDLYAAQIDSMSRKTAIRPLPWAAQVPIAIALALAGAFTAVGLRGRTRLVRVLAVTAIGALFVVAAVLLYRSEQLLVGIPYGLVALALGAWLAGRFSSGGLR